jgi:hypothetical protein
MTCFLLCVLSAALGAGASFAFFGWVESRQQPAPDPWEAIRARRKEADHG